MLLHRQSMINCCVDQKTTTKHEYEISGIQRKHTTLQSVSPPPASHGWDHRIFVHPPSSHGYPVVGLPDITNSMPTDRIGHGDCCCCTYYCFQASSDWPRTLKTPYQHFSLSLLQGTYSKRQKQGSLHYLINV